jgi:hypothetical protein
MIRDIHIRAVLNGFVVRVGCQEVVFDNIDKLLIELGKYLLDPEVVALDYIHCSLNARHVSDLDGPEGGRWSVRGLRGLREAIQAETRSIGTQRTSAGEMASSG